MWRRKPARGASLDYEVTLDRVAHLAVPALADWCAVDIAEAGEPRRISVVHADPARVSLAREVYSRYPPDPAAPHGAVRVLRTGQAELIPEVDDALLVATARDGEHLDRLRALGLRSVMVVPLRARDRVLGALTLATAESGRVYGPGDLAQAEELAARCALALDNARLYRDLQATQRLREEFVAAVAHDLNNPLTVLKGHLQLLQRSLGRDPAPAPEHLRARLEVMEATVGRLGSLLHQLLDVARVQLGQPLELERRPTDLAELVRARVAAQKAASERHTFAVHTPDDPLIADVDPERIGRVVENLLSNAVKYSPDGGRVEVALGREEREGRTWAVLAIRDEGIGIPEAELPRIFIRFHRGTNIADRIHGHGIGLSAAYDLVREHGGTIRVSSREGQDSTFTVWLPLQPPSA